MDLDLNLSSQVTIRSFVYSNIQHNIGIQIIRNAMYIDMEVYYVFIVVFILIDIIASR